MLGWLGLNQGEIGDGVEGGVLEFAGGEEAVAGGGDHGGVVGGEGAAGEEGFDVEFFCFAFEGGAKFGVGRNSTGDEDGAGAGFLGGGEGAGDEIGDDRTLKAGDQIERSWRTEFAEGFGAAFAARDGFFSGINFRL